ncbi:hypothetical protein FRC00_012118, partial [Tulasnella sp. 408]
RWRRKDSKRTRRLWEVVDWEFCRLMWRRATRTKWSLRKTLSLSRRLTSLSGLRIVEGGCIP